MRRARVEAESERRGGGHSRASAEAATDQHALPLTALSLEMQR